jgi:hypothetical protein
MNLANVPPSCVPPTGGSNSGEPPHDDLERALAALTRWEGKEPEVWRRALEREQPLAGGGGLRRLVFNLPRAPLAAAAMVLLAVTIGIALWPSVGARSSHPPVAQAPALTEAQEFFSTTREQRMGISPRSAPPEALANLDASEVDGPDAGSPGAGPLAMRSSEHAAGPAQIESRRQRAVEGDVRHVVRRVTLELQVEDVRAAFARAQMIPSHLHDEFMQSSSLGGDGKSAHAELTMRIAVDRLHAALNELRTLGEVRSEQASGDDVTAQVVDLEARLRNERRIESELLELLDRRTDSALKDVMTVRQSLDQVRQRIEQLTGQREQIRRSVVLATVLVIIRPAGEEEIKPAGAIMDYFKDTVAGAWNRGVVFLADSVGFLVAVVVGGLVWWVMLAAAAALVVAHRRRMVERGLV